MTSALQAASLRDFVTAKFRKKSAKQSTIDSRATSLVNKLAYCYIPLTAGDGQNKELFVLRILEHMTYSYTFAWTAEELPHLIGHAGCCTFQVEVAAGVKLLPYTISGNRHGSRVFLIPAGYTFDYLGTSGTGDVHLLRLDPRRRNLPSLTQLPPSTIPLMQGGGSRNQASEVLLSLPKRGKVRALTATDFDGVNVKGNPSGIVVFAVPWCHYCKELMPVLAEAAEADLLGTDHCSCGLRGFA